jgi:hypothetical protein
MARPTASFGPWATELNFTSGTKTGQPTKVAPLPADLAQGLVAGEPFPSQLTNYVFANAWEWIDYLDSRDSGGGTGNQLLITTGYAPSPTVAAHIVDLSGQIVQLKSIAVHKDAAGASSSTYDLKIEWSNNGGSSWNEVANDLGAGVHSLEHTVTWETTFPINLGTNGRVRVATKTNAGASESHPMQVVVEYAGGTAPLATANPENAAFETRAYSTTLDFTSNFYMLASAATGAQSFELGTATHANFVRGIIEFPPSTASSVTFDSGDFGSTFSGEMSGFSNTNRNIIEITKTPGGWLVIRKAY